MTDVLTLDALRALDSASVLTWLATRRWFGAKAGKPDDAQWTDVVPLPWDDGAFAIARLAVTRAGTTQDLQLPLAVVHGEAAKGVSAIAIVETPSGKASLIDATESMAFRRHLADACARGVEATSPTTGTRWVVEPLSATGLILPDDAPIRVGSAEQSNTSIVFGEAAILKLFRRLEAGEHPDVEVTGFLTRRAQFAHTPVLLATAAFIERDGTRTTAGMLQEYLPGSVDAWGWVLEHGAPYFTAPRGKDPVLDLAPEFGRLGGVTRALHDALASDDDDPAFAPEPAGPEDVERWAHRAQHWIREATALLAQQLAAGKVPAARAAEAEVLVRRRDDYLARVDEIVDAISDDAGFVMRVHGDYHLGQVLRTAGGDYMIIDFEGEPARPLAERRERSSALRDVAGMLRSFGYAAATLGMARGAPDDIATRELRVGRWERDARDAFLRGYLESETAGDEPSDVLPEDEENTRQLLALFETEKAFYELAYELNNRPDWAWIPMRGISKLLVPSSRR